MIRDMICEVSFSTHLQPLNVNFFYNIQRLKLFKAAFRLYNVFEFSSILPI